MNTPIDILTEAGTNRLNDIQVLCKLWGIKESGIFYQDYDTDRFYPYYIPSGKPRRTHEIDAKGVPNFTTDANADYQVLCKVRDHWQWKQIDTFHFELLAIWQNRYYAFNPHRANVGFHLWYEPGDYSRAALNALTE